MDWDTVAGGITALVIYLAFAYLIGRCLEQGDDDEE